MGICSKVPDDKDDGDDSTPVEEDADEDGDEMMEDDEGADADEVDPEELISLGRDQPTEMSSESALPLPQTLITLLSTLNLPSRLVSLARPTPLSFLPLSTANASSTLTSDPSPHPPTTAILSTVHLRALETLNNLFISISFFIPPPTSPEFTSPTWQTFFAHARVSLQPIWDALLVIATEISPGSGVLDVKGQEIRRELLDICVGSMMGLAGITRGGLALNPGTVPSLIEAHKAASRESLKARVLGCLSALALKDVDVTPETIENNRVSPVWSRVCSGSRLTCPAFGQTIGTYLITLLLKPSSISPESMVVALNGIFDIYADETSAWDVEVFRKGNFLEALKSSVSKIRAVVSVHLNPFLLSDVLTRLARADPRHRQEEGARAPRARGRGVREPGGFRQVPPQCRLMVDVLLTSVGPG